ncbi:MAG: SDR family NAD(P)-dependent oxidoreductase [bacterium]|nr:SDR family NAD(P)-dependent oxidoreductase [bacterium]
MRDASRFGEATTADQVLEGIDLTGRRVLVTGASSGIGQETARALAAHGAEVILTARDVAKGEAVAAGIRESAGNPRVVVESVKLGSLASVRDFAARFLARWDTLHVLVNNAGVMACPLAHTADGFERQLGTNHLGHFLLTGLLLPALRRGAPARIVSVSSRGHHLSPVVFEDVHFATRPYDKWLAYGQSKTANVLFAVGLERRLSAQGIHALALHPGAIVTELGRHLVPEDMAFLQQRSGPGGLRLKTVPAGAATSAFAATAPELEGRGGLYLEDCHVAQVNDAEGALDGVKSYAIDPALADRLWALSEAAVGARVAG